MHAPMAEGSIITVEKLGKKYSLRHQRSEGYTALRDVITDKARNLFRRNGRGDVNLMVKTGAAVKFV